MFSGQCDLGDSLSFSSQMALDCVKVGKRDEDTDTSCI